MARRSQKKARGRYTTPGNPEAEYLDPEHQVPVNLGGFTDLAALQLAEEEALAEAYEILLNEVRTDTLMTCELIRHIHHRIFGGLYPWAGRWRTVWISKPGITWPAPDFLDRHMAEFEQHVLRPYRAGVLKDDEAFCDAAARIQGEFLVIHPFREGNARTIKLATDLLAVQSGRPLLVYDSSAAGRDSYIAAADAAFRREYAPMAMVIRHALARAQRER